MGNMCPNICRRVTECCTRRTSYDPVGGDTMCDARLTNDKITLLAETQGDDECPLAESGITLPPEHIVTGRKQDDVIQVTDSCVPLTIIESCE